MMNNPRHSTPDDVWPLRGHDGRTFAEQREDRDREVARRAFTQQRREQAAECVKAYAAREARSNTLFGRLTRLVRTW